MRRRVTTLLFMPDVESCYLTEFRAKVMRRVDNGVVLDRTAFYPEGGGQPSDEGRLRYGEEEVRVSKVIKSPDIIHRLQGQLPDDVTEVTGLLDWARRYALMRMHTAQHIVSHVAFVLFGSQTVGNQIHTDRSRIDLHPLRLGVTEAERFEAAVNDILEEGRRVEILFEERESLEGRIDRRKLDLSLIPTSVTRLRVVSIEGLDETPCAGTHVRSTEEIGCIRIMGRESKGRDRVRITYSLG